tara:strand:- start:149 stop:322 length:174 start_codon:yes stop_codon:yes gene_type:complete
MTLVLLDFTKGIVYVYTKYKLHLNKDGVVDHEEFITNKGHKVNNSEWMLTKNEIIIK